MTRPTSVPFIRRYKFRKDSMWVLNEQCVAYTNVVGTVFRQHQFKDEDGFVFTLSDGEISVLTRTGALRKTTLDEQRIRRVGDAPTGPQSTVWETATEQEKADALLRHHFVDAYLVGGGSARNDGNLARIAAHAWDTRPPSKLLDGVPSPRTLRKWVSRFEGGGLDGLLDQLRRCGNYNRRVSPATWLLTEELAEKHYCSEKRLDQKTVAGLVCAEIKTRNKDLPAADQVSLPSLEVVRRAIAEICPFVVQYTRYGKKSAEEKFRLRTGGITTSRHNERWEVDHTRMNVLVSTAPGSSVKKRPWITVVLDCHTRVVVGFWVGFEAPSAEVTCRALRAAILPKDAILAKYGQGLKNGWPVEGLGMLVCSDQGSDLKSNDLRARLARLRVSSLFTPVLKPWYRARIERFFRTFQDRVSKTLPGSVAGNIFGRDAEMLETSPGCLTLDDVWRIALRYIIDVYNVRHHRGLERAPMEAYRLSVERNEEVPGPSEEEVTRALSWCGNRMLNEIGIRIRNTFYHSAKTAEVFMRNGCPLQVQVYRSPDDLSVAMFRSPEDGKWHEVPVSSKQLDDVRGRTEEEVLCLRRLAIAEADETADDSEDAYARGMQEIAELAERRGHVGRTIEDAGRAKAKLLRGNEALMAPRVQAVVHGDVMDRRDLSDLFGLATDPMRPAVPPVPPPVPQPPKRRRAAPAPAPAQEAAQPVPDEDGDDEDLAAYAARQTDGAA